VPASALLSRTLQIQDLENLNLKCHRDCAATPRKRAGRHPLVIFFLRLPVLAAGGGGGLLSAQRLQSDLLERHDEPGIRAPNEPVLRTEKAKDKKAQKGAEVRGRGGSEEIDV
jgi:hypothetical protein